MLNNPFSSFNPKLSREENIEQRLDLVKSFKAKANAKRSPAEKFADWMTEKFGSIVFLSINGLWFFGWIIINTGLVPGIKPFDPFPGRADGHEVENNRPEPGIKGPVSSPS